MDCVRGFYAHCWGICCIDLPKRVAHHPAPTLEKDAGMSAWFIGNLLLPGQRAAPSAEGPA